MDSFMSKPKYSAAIAYSLQRLEEELAPELTYHNLWHTRDGVMPASMQLAQLSGLGEEEMHLLEVAAAFHDLGFIETHANHELVGARIVAQVLPDFGFSPRQIEAVMGMVIATRLPQSPRNLLEEILADADLDVFGRTDYFSRNDALRQEWANEGQVIAIESWREGQLAFLKSHEYFTPAARMLRGSMKQKHIRMLEEQLAGANN
jgi:uncharacterized protein